MKIKHVLFEIVFLFIFYQQEGYFIFYFP